MRRNFWCYTSAMFCPKCKAEYRQGFNRCSDCGVELVYDLPPEPQPQTKRSQGEWDQEAIQDGEPVRVLWEGESASESADVCQELLEGGISYRVNQSVAGRGLKMHVDFKYQIAVRSTDYEKARKVLGYSDEKDEARWTEEKGENGVLELSERDDLPVQEVHGDWNPRGWFPEDATQEIWSSNPHGGETIFEMCLRENRINYRIEQRGVEPRRVFVMPKDEVRAREILREIVEGAPPE